MYCQNQSEMLFLQRLQNCKNYAHLKHFGMKHSFWSIQCLGCRHLYRGNWVNRTDAQLQYSKTLVLLSKWTADLWCLRGHCLLLVYLTYCNVCGELLGILWKLKNYYARHMKLGKWMGSNVYHMHTQHLVRYLEGQGHSMTKAKLCPAHNFVIWSLNFKTMSQKWSPYMETTCHEQDVGRYFESQGHSMTLQQNRVSPITWLFEVWFFNYFTELITILGWHLILQLFTTISPYWDNVLRTTFGLIPWRSR